MLTLNDFKEKQILLIRNGYCQDGTTVAFANENLVFKKGDKIANRLSCHKIFAIFVMGDTSVTTVFLRNAMKFGISVFFMKDDFDVYTHNGSKAEGNYLLRQKQYSLTEEQEFNIAKKIVENKILNEARLLNQTKKIDNYIELKNNIKKRISEAKDSQELLGIEGNTTKTFFRKYFQDLGWYKRMPRTKVDPYNILLDIGYTFLFNYVDCLLRLYGFDTYKGIYHKLFFNRRSLSCDIMEPFRSIIEKQLLKSFNLKQINQKDFKRNKQQYYLKYDESKKYAEIFLNAIIENKEEIFEYVHQYYKYILDDKNKFPEFKLS